MLEAQVELARSLDVVETPHGRGVRRFLVLDAILPHVIGDTDHGIDKAVERLGIETEDVVEEEIELTRTFGGEVMEASADGGAMVMVSLTTDELGLIDPNELNCSWVTEFPMFEKDEESGRWNAMHHPFTAPLDSDLGLLVDDPQDCRAQAYDLVINGSEAGGGTIRIHDPEAQSRVFDLLGIDEAAAEDLDVVRGLFADTSARLVSMSIAEHDRRMGLVLGLTHLANLGDARSLIENAVGGSGNDTFVFSKPCGRLSPPLSRFIW